MRTQDDPKFLKRVSPRYLTRRLYMENYEARKLEKFGKLGLCCRDRFRLDKLVDGLLMASGLFRWGQKAASNFQLTINRISISNLPAGLEGFRILHLSDLHFGHETDLLDNISTHVRSKPFDLCVITGDFNFEGGHEYQSALKHLAVLRPALGKRVLAILGNHDEISIVPELEELNIDVMLNERRDIEFNHETLTFIGVDDPHYFATDHLEKFRPLPNDKFTLLLSHSSELYKEAERAGVSFLMAGHCHGGQLCLPGGYALINNAKSPKQFIAGSWRYGRLQGYTSAGTSGNSRDVRLFCAPEVVIHELQG